MTENISIVWKLLNELDDLQVRAECGVDALNSTRECLESGNDKPEHYISGLFSNQLFLRDIVKELRKIIDDITEEIRNEKREGVSV